MDISVSPKENQEQVKGQLTMSSIKPFRAVRYNTEKIKDLGKVMCPPYDVMSPDEREDFAARSPYNFVHIILPKDAPDEDRYKRARRIFSEWHNSSILVQDEKPAIYFYKQEYKALGQKYSRLGFISLMHLSDGEDSRVKPHENTHAHAVEDRSKLWRALNANLSCIFVCYSDRQKKIEKIFTKKVLSQQPWVDIVDDDGVWHRLWCLDDAALISEINASLGDQDLFIADGHHRYRVAQELRRQKLAKMTGKPTGDEPFNYVMTYFTNMDSRDLQILPMHRVVKSFPSDPGVLEEYFRIDKISNKRELLIPLARAGKNEHAFGLYTRSGVRLLRLRNKSLVDKFINEGSKEYKHLDATILKYFVFDKAGIKSEDIIYTKDFDEVISMVDQGQAAAGFIMNPVPITQLQAIALNGEKMPPKTTYFYPKVLSGLTVYTMD
ncbi:MAG TPA: hypothetical protein DE315_01230 [Candidatus Omnitrophica bacterium]|nr:hypothetical protein [Candidatus Omnitrophota bacterium]HCI44144.1 hypothetical protein [Candidatus Omnitrophota bacterium]